MAHIVSFWRVSHHFWSEKACCAEKSREETWPIPQESTSRAIFPYGSLSQVVFNSKFLGKNGGAWPRARPGGSWCLSPRFQGTRTPRGWWPGRRRLTKPTSFGGKSTSEVHLFNKCTSGSVYPKNYDIWHSQMRKESARFVSPARTPRRWSGSI